MTDAVAVAKRRYSSELAAYTFEQWRLAHQKMHAEDNGEGGRKSPPDLERKRTSRPASSLLAADLATKPLPAINGTA